MHLRCNISLDVAIASKTIATNATGGYYEITRTNSPETTGKEKKKMAIGLIIVGIGVIVIGGSMLKK